MSQTAEKRGTRLTKTRIIAIIIIAILLVWLALTIVSTLIAQPIEIRSATKPPSRYLGKDLYDISINVTVTTPAIITITVKTTNGKIIDVSPSDLFFVVSGLGTASITRYTFPTTHIEMRVRTEIVGQLSYSVIVSTPSWSMSMGGGT